MIGKRYVLQEQLGEGAMGQVFRALDRMTGRMVAIKRLKPQTGNKLSESNSQMLSLAHEFKILAGLRHPNIISVLDYGFETPQQPYVVMDYLAAATEFSYYVDGLPMHERLSPVLQLLQALAYLHRRGVVHRDLKPSNVMVTIDGSVKVLDFGLAGESGSQDEAGGTLLYMAPEVLRGAAITPASDLYAVGVMLYEALTGRHPFRTQHGMSDFIETVLHQAPDLTLIPAVLSRTTLEMPLVSLQEDAPTVHIAHPTPASDTNPSQLPIVPLPSQPPIEMREPPKTLRELVGRLLAKRPDERYNDAAKVLTDLCTTADIPPPTESAAIRESFLQAATFVGREHELATLDSALAQARQGQGSVWLIGGESGVGKSRLLDEARTRALIQGMPVLRGQAVREESQPFRLWQDVARHLAFMVDLSDYEAALLQLLVPDLAHLRGKPIPPSPGAEMTPHTLERLLGVLQAVLERVSEAMVIILEDIHWGAEWLPEVSVSNTRHLILASYRHDEAPDLANRLPTCQVLHLTRLDYAGVETLSQSMLGTVWPELVEHLAEESEGNLFFLVEMVRLLAEEAGGLAHAISQTLPMRLLTGGMQTILERRLAHIPATARPLLELAAVVGRRLDLDLLGRLAALDLEQWLLHCSAVLELADEHWQFAHDKLREAVLATIAPDELPKLHRRIALALESREANADSPTLAYHWGAGGNPYKEAYYCVQTADHFLWSGIKYEALQYVERAKAIDAAYSLEPHQRMLLLRTTGMTYLLNGQPTVAHADLEESLALAQTLNDQLGLARVFVALGYLAAVQSKTAEAIDYYERGLALGRDLDDTYSIARSLYGLGMSYMQISRLDEAEAYYRQALEIYEANGMTHHVCDTLSHLGNVARNRGDIDGAEALYARALTIATEASEVRVLVSIRLGISSMYYRRGQFDKAIAEAEAVVAVERQHRFRRGVAAALSALGLYLAVSGQHERAEACWLEASGYFREANERLPLARTVHNLGDLYNDRGDLEQAQTYLAESLAMFEEVGNIQGRLITIGKLAGIAFAKHEMQTAERLYRSILDEAIPLKLRSDMLHTVYGLGRLKAWRGDSAEAIAYLTVVAQADAGYPDVKQKAVAALADLTDTPLAPPTLTLEDIIALETPL